MNPASALASRSSSLTITFGDFPVPDLLAVLAGLPLVAVAGGWLLAGRPAAAGNSQAAPGVNPGGARAMDRG